MRRTIWIFCLMTWLSACTNIPLTSPTAPQTQSGGLTAFHTLTPSSTPSPLPVIPTVVLTPVPTPTPFSHTIAKGDTLLGIALRYGVTLDELKEANPGVDPGFLVVGNLLIIPIEGQENLAIPAVTPLPIKWQSPRCYSSADGGLYCFILITNDQSTTIENQSAWVNLVDSRGTPQAAQPAVAPLNILPAGSSMPLIAYFPPPVEDDLIPQGQLLSALAVGDGDVRYVAAQVSVNSVDISEDGLSAAVTGEIQVPKGTKPSVVWLAMVAYDEMNNVVAMRKFDLGAPCGVPPTMSPTNSPQPTLASGAPTSTPTTSATSAPLKLCVPFEYSIYSLGSHIQRVDVLLEVRR